MTSLEMNRWHAWEHWQAWKQRRFEHLTMTCPEIHGKLLRWRFNDPDAPMTASEIRARAAIDNARYVGKWEDMQ